MIRKLLLLLGQNRGKDETPLPLGRTGSADEFNMGIYNQVDQDLRTHRAAHYQPHMQMARSSIDRNRRQQQEIEEQMLIATAIHTLGDNASGPRKTLFGMMTDISATTTTQPVSCLRANRSTNRVVYTAVWSPQ